jgi:hypothetical protein
LVSSLLTKTKKHLVAEYARSGINNPMGVVGIWKKWGLRYEKEQTHSK